MTGVLIRENLDRYTHTERERERNTERERQTERDRDRNTKRDREAERRQRPCKDTRRRNDYLS